MEVGGGVRALVIGADPSTTRLFEQALVHHDCDLLRLEPAAAPAAVRDQPLWFVAVDCDLPEVSGPDLCSMLRAERGGGELAVLALVSPERFDHHRALKAAHVRDVLPKP